MSITAGVVHALPLLMETDYWAEVQLVALGRSTQEELEKRTEKVVFTCQKPTPTAVVSSVEKALESEILKNSDS